MAKFKENTNMFHIGTMDAPIIHGHTCIELKDARTGKRERIESDNTFMATTLAKQMRSFGISNNNPYANTYWRNANMVTNFCGGILLFKNTIADGSEYMPAGNKMTANGSYNVANGGNPPELGSWNSIESNIDGNRSAVLVWDWSTSQGNGEISSVCLTSDTGGYIGYGNASGYSTSGISVMRNQNSNSIQDGNARTIKDNLVYTFSWNKDTRILTVRKYKQALELASIFDKKLIETLTFDLTDSEYDFISQSSNSLRLKTIDHNKVMICNGNSYTVYNGQKFQFLIFDPDDDSLTIKEIMNTTGVAFSTYYNDSNAFTYFDDDDLLFAYDGTTLYVIDGSDGSLEKTLSGITAGDVNTDYYDKLSANLFTHRGFWKFIDLVNDTVYPTNANAETFVYNGDKDCLLNGPVWMGTSAGLALYKNPLYLATINNLQQSVTKQNTQTMKVTYTLTEV